LAREKLTQKILFQNLKPNAMPGNQTPVLLRNGLKLFLLIVCILLFGILYKVNQSLFWALLILAPLLIFVMYSGRRKRQYPVIDSFTKSLIMPANSLGLENYAMQESNHGEGHKDLSATIGNHECSEPFRTSIFDIRIKNYFFKIPFRHQAKKLISNTPDPLLTESDTAELAGGGKILQIDPSYPGCRTERGGFDAGRFRQIASDYEVKMIELNLSPGTNPFFEILTGGRMAGFHPALDDSPLYSTLGYSVFSSAEGMILFLGSLREHSGGKPVGIRLFPGNKKDIYEICHAIHQTQIVPDFIVVDDPENSQSLITSSGIHSDMTLYEALLFLARTLQHYKLDNKIGLIAAGNIISPFEILKLLALGATAIHTEMLAYRVIRNSRNGTIEEQFDNMQPITRLYNMTMKTTAEMMEIGGFRGVSDITLPGIFKQLDKLYMNNYQESNELYLKSRAKTFMLNSQN
jgi:hypothetical protein